MARGAQVSSSEVDVLVEPKEPPRKLRLFSTTIDAWTYRRGITLAFIQPGNPTQNAFIESVNSRLRDECLKRALVCDGDRSPICNRALA